MATHARERLLRTAEQLFYAEGVRAVGVERLLTVSGVGRASFYRHFASKDDLIVAVLRNYDEAWRSWLTQRVEELGGDPLAVFDALAERCASADYRGCASINTMVETVDESSPAYQVALTHKRAVTDYLDGLLSSAGRPDHALLAEHFMQLIDGALVTALRERGTEPAHRARAAAGALLTVPPVEAAEGT
jgi:AcrR family transcriptional regulator